MQTWTPLSWIFLTICAMLSNASAERIASLFSFKASPDSFNKTLLYAMFCLLKKETPKGASFNCLITSFGS
jgi:hypothetical protein